MGKFKLVPETPPRLSPAERKRLGAMSEADIEAAAKADADNPPLTAAELRRLTTARLVKATRARTGLPQDKFAAAYRINLGRLRDLEQGRTKPDSAMEAYLTLIAKDPEYVRQTLSVTRVQA